MSALAARMGKAVQFRAERPLTDDEIARVAPSVFANEPHASRSARYAYIPTSKVLDGLRKEGFEPFMVAQGRCRVEGKEDFTKHMLRLRHADQIAGSEANEIVLINSHDGTSSYQMLAGLLRFVCANGMVCGDILQDIRIKHTGDIVHEVIEGAHTVLDGFGLIRDVTEEMKSIRLLPAEQGVLANAALVARYEDRNLPRPIEVGDVLRARRWEDRDDSLWATFNRIQENIIRGGVQGRNAQGRRMTTRPVQAIDSDVKINRALWTLAQGMAEIKSGRAEATPEIELA
ncbi:DUF932 domain-containing protein [Paraburkholderia sp. BR10923]|uniref:DUF932 domain-containing protein n=1 Tax=Paraburkholderia sp. BR10923 TaxID=3236992 RepID=UPI0034CDDED6